MAVIGLALGANLIRSASSLGLRQRKIGAGCFSREPRTGQDQGVEIELTFLLFGADDAGVELEQDRARFDVTTLRDQDF